MRMFLIFVLSAIVAISFFVPDSVFGCSLAFDLGPFKPYTTNLNANCSEDIGHLSWTGLIIIMLGVFGIIYAVKKFLKLPRKFYLIIIPVIFIGILLYSVAFYGTADLTEFFLPHDYLGNLDHFNTSEQLASNDFDDILAKHNIQYRSENRFVTFNHDKYTREQYLANEFSLPYEYCGIAIADDHTEYWYSAVYDEKKISESKFYEENPKQCDQVDKTCFCQVTNILRDHFKFRP
jgi:hypothetical protein